MLLQSTNIMFHQRIKQVLLESLAKAVKPNGVVYVHSVESERCFYDPNNW